MSPTNFVDPRIRLYITFEVNIYSLLDGAAIKSASKFQTYERNIWNYNREVKLDKYLLARFRFAINAGQIFPWSKCLIIESYCIVSSQIPFISFWSNTQILDEEGDLIEM